MFVHKLYRFSIDEINGRFISGWCFQRIHRKRPVTIRFAADNTFLGSVKTSEYRKDLLEKGLHPTGVCGFDFSLPRDFDPARHQTLSIYFDNVRKPFVTFDCQQIEHLHPEHYHPVFFMHIPKTAGSSFNAFARTCYAKADYQTHIERLSAKERHELMGKKNYVAGHLPMYMIKKLPEISSYELYAIAREPFRHLHSHINYVKQVYTASQHTKHYTFQHNETIKAMGMALSHIKFKDSSAIREFVENLKSHELDFFDNMQTRYFLDYRPEKVRNDDIERAKQNINRFRLIGLTEEYDRFRDEFCNIIGLPPQKQKQHSNKSDYYQLFDPADQETRNILMPLIEADQQIYAYIKERYWAR